jgi:hypothetical protein
MSGGSVRELRARRDAALREARVAALDRPDEDLRAKIERIEAYDRLLAATPKHRWRELAWAVAVAVVCVSLLGAALSIRVPSARIVLEVTAGTATVALAEPWQFNDSAAVQTRLLSLREVEELELPAVRGMPEALVESAWVDVDGGRVALAALSFADGNTLTFEVGPGRDVNLYARGASLAGAVTLTGSQRLAAGQGISDGGTAHETMQGEVLARRWRLLSGGRRAEDRERAQDRDLRPRAAPVDRRRDRAGVRGQRGAGPAWPPRLPAGSDPDDRGIPVP